MAKARRQPTEELRVAIEKLPEAVLKELAEAVSQQAGKRGMFIEGEDKSKEVLPIALTPWVFNPEFARYLKTFFRGIRRTVNRVLANYFEDPRLQAILPLRESEINWLKSGCADGIPHPQTIFERFDTNLCHDFEKQASNFKVIEFNGVGVGCIYLTPAATEILEAALLTCLGESLNGIKLVAPPDYRQLLLTELQAHSKAIDRPECRMGLVERRESVLGGCDEFSYLAEYFSARGSPTVMGDPREIERHNGDIVLKGQKLDVVYRDFQLEEVVSIKTHGGQVEGIETAFAKNQVVSTVFGEFDHKSLCELLSNPEFSDYFTPIELKAARGHFPWTRLLTEKKTTDPQGKEVELTVYVKENQDKLVLKPNRGYGGEGVVVGEAVSKSAWEEALTKAFQKPGTWVAQEQVPIGKASLMVLGSDGKIKTEERYVTLGVTATARAVSFVGRCSSKPVVNISQGGGLVPVFLAGKA